MEKLFVYFAFFYETFPSIRLSEKFLPFHEEIIDAQRFFFYIILSNYVRSILFCSNKHRHISHTCFHVCIVIKITFAKERYFPDNIILRYVSLSKGVEKEERISFGYIIRYESKAVDTFS